MQNDINVRSMLVHQISNLQMTCMTKWLNSISARCWSDQIVSNFGLSHWQRWKPKFSIIRRDVISDYQNGATFWSNMQILRSANYLLLQNISLGFWWRVSLSFGHYCISNVWWKIKWKILKDFYIAAVAGQLTIAQRVNQIKPNLFLTYFIFIDWFA